MYYWPMLMLFFGGFIPLIISRRWVKSGYGVLVLGWLAWVCGVSLKGFLNLTLSVALPQLFTDMASYVLLGVAVESTEVLAAFLFLRYHPAFRKLALQDVVAFGIGFGVGEAFTGAAFSFIFADIPFYGIASFAAMVERWSAVMIHLASAVFIGLYVMQRRRMDIAAGLLIKDLSVFSLVLPSLMSAWFAGNWPIYVTELLIMLYAAVSMSLAFLRARGEAFGKPLATPVMRRKQLVVAGTTFALASFLFQSVLVYASQDQVQATYLAVAYAALVAALFRLAFNTSITEMLAGAFIGSSVYYIFYYNLLALENPLIMANFIGFTLAGSSILSLFGALCGVYIMSAFRKRKLNIFS